MNLKDFKGAFIGKTLKVRCRLYGTHTYRDEASFVVHSVTRNARQETIQLWGEMSGLWSFEPFQAEELAKYREFTYEFEASEYVINII